MSKVIDFNKYVKEAENLYAELKEITQKVLVDECYRLWDEMDKRVNNNGGMFTEEDLKTPIRIIGGIIKPIGKLTGEEIRGAMLLRDDYLATL